MPLERAFFDTIILLYAITRSPLEIRKRDQAQDLPDGEPGVLCVQVIQEFIV